MFDTKTELIEKINLAEDSELELKSVRLKEGKIAISRDKIADEIAAFANSADGIIIFGVDDKTKLIEGIDLDKLDELETIIRDIVNDSIKPPVSVKIITMNLPNINGDSVPVLKVDILKSLFVHESPGGYLQRIGSSKRKMQPEALARLFQQRSQTRIIRFDEQHVPDTSISDLNKDLFKKFDFKTNDSFETICEKLKLITKDEAGNKRLTVAGALLCADNPEKFIPNAFIEAVAYKGLARNSNYQNNAKKITGPLDKQIIEAVKFIQANMKIKAIKDPGRIDIPQFSIKAVFEAIVNAAAHRDYSIFGSKIRLFMFDDRLEIYSPGTIPNSMTIESLPLRQSTRNELITSLLARCKVDITETKQFMMEKRGEGVPIIISGSEKLSGKKPVYQLIDNSELLLTIYSS